MTPMEQEGDIPSLETHDCDGPCPPNDQCPCCYSYWERMVAEGYWDRERNQWTDKGWTDILRHA